MRLSVVHYPKGTPSSTTQSPFCFRLCSYNASYLPNSEVASLLSWHLCKQQVQLFQRLVAYRVAESPSNFAVLRQSYVYSVTAHNIIVLVMPVIKEKKNLAWVSTAFFADCSRRQRARRLTAALRSEYAAHSRPIGSYFARSVNLPSSDAAHATSASAGEIRRLLSAYSPHGGDMISLNHAYALIRTYIRRSSTFDIIRINKVHRVNISTLKY